MTHAGYIGGPFDQSAAKATNYGKRKKKVKEDDMGIGHDLKDSAWKASMLRSLDEARDKGHERQQETIRRNQEKAAALKSERRKKMLDEWFSKLPKLLEDAVAAGKNKFQFIPVSFESVTSSGLGKYNPKPGTDAELALEILQELELIADVESVDGFDERMGLEVADTYVVVQV
jgi:hypothetical protein